MLKQLLLKMNDYLSTPSMNIPYLYHHNDLHFVPVISTCEFGASKKFIMQFTIKRYLKSIHWYIPSNRLKI